MKESEPLSVFISYAHKDHEFLDRLRVHLSPLRQERIIRLWDDKSIQAGEDWAEQIDNGLEEADIILLLVSPYFLASEFCQNTEMNRALERHRNGESRVIPVIIEDSDWKTAGFAHLQALPDGGEAISTWKNSNTALVSVAQGIRRAALSMRAENSEPPIPPLPTPPPKARPSAPDASNPIAEVNWHLVDWQGDSFIAHVHEEERCVEELRKPGRLVRIKSPDKMGKSSMMGRVLRRLNEHDYRSVIFNLRKANQDILDNIDTFLRWFCDHAADELDVDIRASETWKDFRTPNDNANKFFERHLLKPYDKPLVIAIDNFDSVFKHSNIETDFCGLLRGWFEAKNGKPEWGMLRQIIVYSQESYGTMDINQSPLNVGMTVELNELTVDQVTALARATDMNWEQSQSDRLVALVGGHPFLVQVALEKVRQKHVDLDRVLEDAHTEEGIFGSVLSEQFMMLEKNEALSEAMRKVVNSEKPIRLRADDKFQLVGMGLVRSSGNDCLPGCSLYRDYFKDRLR